MTFYDIEMSGVFLAVLGIVFLAGLIPAVLFLMNLRGLLEQVRPQNRTMQPNLVWLNLIPLFNYVWLIITVVKVRDSVDSEIRSRGWTSKGDNGFGVGLAFAILWLVAGFWLLIPFLVCWIVYWIKTAELKKQLSLSQPPAGWASLPAPSGYGGAGPAGGQEASADVEEGQARDSKDCPMCGASNRPDARFCRSCGRSVV